MSVFLLIEGKQVGNVFADLRQTIAHIPGARRMKRFLFGPNDAPSLPPGPRPRDRGPAPRVDPGQLLREYQLSGLHSEPDTFVLYRIIGNDLPPRHVQGQSRANLAFILEHEPNFPDCEKRFVVNRIVDPGEDTPIRTLLDRAGYAYHHIPFNLDEYRSIPWDLQGIPPEYAPYSQGFTRLSPAEQGRVLMRLYRHKNNYVMHNNGARNLALRDGRNRAKWVLPWDGNCFLTAQAWEAIKASVVARPEIPYHIVPMARITDNALLLRQDFSPPALEEPQILFRKDAELEFNPDYPYGRRPKVELLWRLGVPGSWDGWSLEPWDFPCPDYAEQAGTFAMAGWVARLFSGQVELEENPGIKTEAMRGLARVDAVLGTLDELDDQAHGPKCRPLAPVFIPAKSEIILRPKGQESITKLLHLAAEQALLRGPYSVVHKKTMPPSGRKHDYYHPAPYYWPHPLRLPFLPYVRRDGRRVPGTRLYEPLSDNYDRTRLQLLFDDGYVLALAWQRFGDARYLEHCAKLVHCWFLAPETAMTPHLEYAQVIPGGKKAKGNSSGLIETKDLYFFLDALRILHAAEVFSINEWARLHEWLATFLNWLRTSPQGSKERASRNNHGTYYDLQTASLAAFLGDHRLLRSILMNSRMRILQQFEPNGAQPHELRRTITAHYCCFNLQGWIHLARLAEKNGEDLWNVEGPRGQGLRKGMEWLLAHMGQPWPYQQIEEFDAERFYPIYHAYRSQYGANAALDSMAVPPAHQIKPVFHPHDGIRPFWQVADHT